MPRGRTYRWQSHSSSPPSVCQYSSLPAFPRLQGVVRGALCAVAAGPQPSLALWRRGGLGAGGGAQPGNHGVRMAGGAGSAVPARSLGCQRHACAVAAATGLTACLMCACLTACFAAQAALPVRCAGGAAAGRSDNRPHHLGKSGCRFLLLLLLLIPGTARSTAAVAAALLLLCTPFY